MAELRTNLSPRFFPPETRALIDRSIGSCPSELIALLSVLLGGENLGEMKKREKNFVQTFLLSFFFLFGKFRTKFVASIFSREF